jgi:streptogrisin D
VRLTVTIPLLALCSLSLTTLPSAALPPTAAEVPSAACAHARPTTIPTDAQRLAQPTSATDHRPLGEAVGESVSESVRSSEPLTDTGRPTSGLPYGLSQGIVGVLGSADTGYKVIVDESVIDAATYRNGLAKKVPANGLTMVAVERSCRSAKSIAAAWTKVAARDWHPGAKKTTFTADLDPATEQILVEYDKATTSADNVAALVSIDPAVIHAVPGAPQRMTRLNDTPTGGHWGGARITSPIRNCTAGFTVVRRSNGARASVTAGHCGGVGTVWYSGSNYYGTTSVRTDYPDYDQALVTGSSYGPKIWTDGAGDTEDVRTVTGAGDPAVGSQICQSGSYSGSLCGITVQSNSATFCDEAGCTTYVMRGTKSGQIVIRGGDSGGPIYTKPGADWATIRGSAIAGSGCHDGSCTTIYAERYNSIAGHLGVYALTG